MRGLKPYMDYCRLVSVLVASFTDAWIETWIIDFNMFVDAVASFTDAWIETRKRLNMPMVLWSHPLRMRGLKPYTDFTTKQSGFVASFTDAWIETCAIMRRVAFLWVASFTDAWIETNKTPQRTDSGIVASFTDAWIETWWKTGAATWRTVASFTDAWIETTFIR